MKAPRVIERQRTSYVFQLLAQSRSSAFLRICLVKPLTQRNLLIKIALKLTTKFTTHPHACTHWHRQMVALRAHSTYENRLNQWAVQPLKAADNGLGGAHKRKALTTFFSMKDWFWLYLYTHTRECGWCCFCCQGNSWSVQLVLPL